MEKIKMKESTKMKANAADVVRVMLPERYEMGATNLVPMQDIDEASWIWMKDSVGDNVFLRFEKEFESDGKAFRIHVSADERYVLELDGMRISMGPDRSIEERWTYKTYDIKVSSGKHVFPSFAGALEIMLRSRRSDGTRRVASFSRLVATMTPS